MLSLSAIAKREKNKLSTNSAFVILLDIELIETIRICYNTEDVVWNGNVYQAFPFTLGEVSENTDNSDPNVELKVSNVTQALEPYIETSGGAIGTRVILRVVNTEALDNTEAELEEFFSVTKTSVNAEEITFSLGNEYSSRTTRPLNRYMKNNCPFKYKGVRCGCTSSFARCGHTLADCRARNNSKRFGGYQGIDQKGVYVSG